MTSKAVAADAGEHLKELVHHSTATSPRGVLERLFTLAFSGHAASGTIGCETYTARVRTKTDGSFRFRKIARDDAGCPSPMSRPPGDHLDVLASTVSFRTDGTAIILVDADGHDRLRFEPVAS